jgi:hypothetical protein
VSGSLDSVRTGQLNDELGLVDDTDVSFGDTARRNRYLQNAYRRLWPEMAQLVRADVAAIDEAHFYDLTASGILDIERITTIDASADIIGAVTSWLLLPDHTTSPPTLRLEVPGLTAGTTLRVWGYKRWSVPATGPSTCDLPEDLHYVVAAGAREDAYRAKMNEFADFERFANENRANALSAAEVIELMAQARRDFDRYKADNARPYIGAQRARTTLG